MLLLLVPIISPTTTTQISTTTMSTLYQPPIEWEKTYGSPESGMSYFVQQTTDGGYIATGVIYTTGGTNPELYLVKTDANGNLQWSQIFGGAPTFDCGYCVQQTTDSGYIIAGCYHGYGLWLIKTDSSGNQQWNQVFSSLSLDTAFSVQQTNDGGYILVGGYTYAPGPPDVWVIKTDSAGNQLWDKKIGGGNAEYGHCIRQTTDTGYIITGYTDSFGAGQEDVYLLKLDNAGNTVWSKTFGGNNDDRGNSVRQTTDGGYIVAGYTKSFGAGQADVYLLKTDASGNLIWSQTFGGASDDEGNSVRQTPDSGYIICGTTQTFGGGGVDIYLIKIDSTAAKQWDTTYGGPGNDDGQCVDTTTDGNYILACTKYTTYTEFWLIKLGIPSNHPPNQPAKPTGPTNGKTGTPYTYNASTIDPDGDNVYYWFDWGDGTNSGWVGPYASGATGNATHTWTTKGTYNIIVKAKDDPHAAESPFSPPLSVSMPRNKITNQPILRSIWNILHQSFFLHNFLNQLGR